MDVMQLRRNLLMNIASATSGLPSAYRQVDYLQGSGTQYIATNFVAPAGVTVEWDYAVTAAFTGDKMMWGSAGSDSSKRCYAERYGIRWYCANGEARYANVLSGYGAVTGTRYSASMDSSSLVIDGQSATPTSTNYLAPEESICIFAWNNAGTAQWIHPSLRMYSLTFKNGNTVLADFVPCVRISDSKPGMYDLVGRQFYTNAGTGEFIIPT